MSDTLRQYTATRSPDAFRRIVQSHVNIVYSQCLRELRDPDAAEDVTQQVFITLARKASKISPSATLDGWLFLTTRFCCRNHKRAVGRRRFAENRAALMRNETIEPTTDDFSAQAEPILDDALADLSARDRNALLLRFFQNQPLRQVGIALGISEDAAKQRVSRAVEKLRIYFARRGITATSASIAGFLASAIRPATAKAAECALNAYAASAPATAVHATLFARALALPKIATAVMVAGTVATAAVAIHAAAAQSAPPPASSATVAITPHYADVAPPNLPATQPLAQSTPLGTLQKLCSALEAGDHEAVDECLTDDGKDPAAARVGRATVQSFGNIYRLEKIWKEKFNSDMKVSGLNFDTFPGGDYLVLIRGTADAGANLEVSFDGDEARVKVPVAADKFTGTGLDRITAEARWSGAMLVFTRVDGDWKLNTDRTFNFVINIFREPRNKTDSVEIEAGVSEGINQLFEDLIGKIESGQINTKGRAVTAVSTGVSKIFKDNNINGCSYMMLPVIGGNP